MHRLVTVGEHVVNHVAVHRHVDLGLAALHRAQEVEQLSRVVALGKSLAVENAASLELGVGVQEPVSRHQFYMRVLWPS